jgi:hypothetical protein
MKLAHKFNFWLSPICNFLAHGVRSKMLPESLKLEHFKSGSPRELLHQVGVCRQFEFLLAAHNRMRTISCERTVGPNRIKLSAGGNKTAANQSAN